MSEVLTDTEYYHRRTEGWKWIDGEFHWWEIFVMILGMHGGGGFCIVELWRWNGSSETLRTNHRNLSHTESLQLIKELEDVIRQRKAHDAGRDVREAPQLPDGRDTSH